MKCAHEFSLPELNRFIFAMTKQKQREKRKTIFFTRLEKSFLCLITTKIRIFPPFSCISVGFFCMHHFSGDIK